MVMVCDGHGDVVSVMTGQNANTVTGSSKHARTVVYWSTWTTIIYHVHARLNGLKIHQIRGTSTTITATATATFNRTILILTGCGSCMYLSNPTLGLLFLAY